jgi:hypothetical protein
VRFLTKKLYFLALLVAALSWSGNAFAQEKNDSSGSWYEEELQEEPKVSRKVLRKQMLADQRTLSVMYEQATGEFAARPTVRFPDYMAYRPSLPHTYYATPFRWNRPYNYRWY